MGHIVLGAGIDRFHLHERLLRALRERGHRASVLGLHPVARTFWRHQDEDAVELRAGAAAAASVPIDELGPHTGDRAMLAAEAGALDAWFAAQRPDLVLLHQDRGAFARLVQFVARAHGCRVLWTGAGLLPHTLQLDERGLDGDAACSLRAAGEFRVVRGEPELLRACLANALARTTPSALKRGEVKTPPLRERLRDVLPTWRRHGFAQALAGLRAWRQAQASEALPELRGDENLPPAPFVVVLLQQADDARVRLDASDAPSAATLVRATVAAARQLGCDVAVVAVAAAARHPRWLAGCPVLPPAAAAVASATALATVTINHGMAAVALLAGTPVLHLGHALYGVRGVAVRTTLASLGGDLRRALAHDHPTLRERFLTWLFGHGHVWCSPTHPDHNGMQGLVLAVEARLAGAARELPTLRYRQGPAWPLEGQRRRP